MGPNPGFIFIWYDIELRDIYPYVVGRVFGPDGHQNQMLMLSQNYIENVREREPSLLHSILLRSATDLKLFHKPFGRSQMTK